MSFSNKTKYQLKTLYENIILFFTNSPSLLLKKDSLNHISVVRTHEWWTCLEIYQLKNYISADFLLVVLYLKTTPPLSWCHISILCLSPIYVPLPLPFQLGKHNKPVVKSHSERGWNYKMWGNKIINYKMSLGILIWPRFLCI